MLRCSDFSIEERKKKFRNMIISIIYLLHFILFVIYDHYDFFILTDDSMTLVLQVFGCSSDLERL